MSITFTNLGASANPDLDEFRNQTSYSNSSWTPPTSGLICLFVATREASGANGPPTVTGNSLTWTQIATVTFEVGDWRITLFAADATGSSTGATTADYGSDTQLHCNMFFCQVTGVDLSSGVAGAFVQSQTAEDSGTPATSGSVTLSSFASSDNRPLACFWHGATETITVEAGWTQLDAFTGTGASRGGASMYRDDSSDLTPSASWSTSTDWGGIAVELKAEAAAAAGQFMTTNRGYW